MNKPISVMLQKVILLITYWSEDSKKKKDIFSCIFLEECVVFLGIAFSCFLPLFRETISIIGQLEKLINNFNLDTFYNFRLSINFNFIEDMLFVKLFLSLVLQTILVIGLANIGIKKRLHFLLSIVIQIMIFAMLFDNVVYVSFLLIVCLFILNIFFPLGSGVYFEVAKYAYYFVELYQYNKQNEIKDNKGGSLPKLVIGIIGGLGFAVSIKLLFPICSLQLIFMLYGAIILLLYINSSRGKIQMLIRKIVVYSLIAFCVLANNNSFQKSIISMILAVVSIFFALDRIIELFKVCKNVVKQESLIFLIDEIDEDHLLLKERFDISQVEQLNIPEDVLLRQIVIHCKLQLPSVTRLIQIYRELGYQRQTKLVNSVEYFTVIDENTSLEKREELLLKIWNGNDSGYELISLSEEYAFVLFYLKKDYEKIIKILEEHWIYLADDSKYILYYAYTKTNETVAANTVKKEIVNFQQTEKNMVSQLAVYIEK